ncbi:hypothetical protein PPL_09613 [Heterostelium album PN500]|uniref:G domain-containing protein n=1 Tax=Heterostelium pallidum (strain ATCC 26659 / Pp 5 / PN500) TaxID=670386 RepID=D3BNU2_HETP5|nr:hypothetical protein PPL_09613 [Heterostelium album PN500]EFA76861.1 hypothetical protein PPL_09613 [Heterostelium album PN500]|eukprot:XP_020428993.1 hypothetical protein PPL_09613 [Heterostelium album PN500]
MLLFFGGGSAAATAATAAVGTTNQSFRSSFTYGGKINWFPGHMIKATKQLKENIKNVDVVLEIRDSRAPLSTENPLLQDILRQTFKDGAKKTHIVVFNKADMSNHNLQSKIKLYYDQYNRLTEDRAYNKHIAFTQSASKTNSAATTHQSHPRHPYQVIKNAVELHRQQQDKLQQQQQQQENNNNNNKIIDTTIIDRKQMKKEINMLVIGVPNVGKSSLINSIRNACRMTKSAKTGALPGVTRNITGFRVSDDPPAFLVDTPGIMIPGVLEDVERALTLSLVGAISEKIVDHTVVADYLLFKMNQMRITTYVTVLKLDAPTDDINRLLEHICQLKGMYLTNQQQFQQIKLNNDRLNSNKTNDTEQASRYLINLFREGKFGNFTLDKIPSPPTSLDQIIITTPNTLEILQQQQQQQSKDQLINEK